MKEILYDEVPSLDLNDFVNGTDEQRQKFVADLGAAYENIGFVAISNHGLTDSLTQELYKKHQAFFQLDQSVKDQYAKPELNYQVGYTPKNKEKAANRKVADLKEFYHVGQMPTDEEKKDFPENAWPAEIDGIDKVSIEAYKTLEATGKNMLRAIALYLGKEEDYFEAKVHNGNSIMRSIHYFPITNPEALPKDAVRAAEHGDINLITLLMGASADGLQVLRRDGEWIPITALPKQIIVNVGDMLSRHTNNKLKSTIHRVVNPPVDQLNTSRYSIPFFMHPRSDMDLSCMDTCVDEANPKQYDDITAGEFLNQRLAEIGLKK